jgi:hypothetical protein
MDLRRDLLKQGHLSEFLSTFPPSEILHGFQILDSIPIRFNAQEYWSLVRQVWLLSKVVSPDTTAWIKIFTSRRSSSRHLFMDAGEQDRFCRLPDVIDIYRGVLSTDDRGISWSLSRYVASLYPRSKRTARSADGKRRHAGLMSKQRILLEGRVGKADVFACFNGRNESEIIVDPRTVQIVRFSHRGKVYEMGSGQSQEAGQRF